MLERALAILNPAAGRGRVERVWAVADRVLSQAGWKLEVARSSAAGDATTLARRAAQEAVTAVIAVGGDGTINEVATGLLQAEEGGSTAPPLGILPAGSGNDLAKPLRIPIDPAAAARTLLEAAPHSIDVARVGDRWFLNGLGVGFDARVAGEARGVRWLRGTPRYALALVRALRSFRAPRVRVVADGTEIADRPVTLVTVANGPCCGGGFWLCPDADVSDGRLDVLVADARNAAGIVGFLARSLSAAHVGAPGIRIVRAATIEITSDAPLPVHVDGQILDPVSSLGVRLLPGRLRVLTARSPGRADGPPSSRRANAATT